MVVVVIIWCGLDYWEEVFKIREKDKFLGNKLEGGG